MTKIKEAHSICSVESRFSASGLRPAESTSISGQDEKTCSAVGLLKRLRLQIKSTLCIRQAPPLPVQPHFAVVPTYVNRYRPSPAAHDACHAPAPCPAPSPGFHRHPVR